MTAYNVVRFRVKPGMEDKFIASQRASLANEMPGVVEMAMIKTGDRSYCLIGKWQNFSAIIAARTSMIAILDEIRPLLEDLGGGLGVTDPVSGETVIQTSR